MLSTSREKQLDKPQQSSCFRVQQETESKGGANVEMFPFSIVIEKGAVLQAQGGITLIDSPQHDEFSVEVSGVDLSNLNV